MARGFHFAKIEKEQFQISKMGSKMHSSSIEILLFSFSKLRSYNLKILTLVAEGGRTEILHTVLHGQYLSLVKISSQKLL